MRFVMLSLLAAFFSSPGCDMPKTEIPAEVSLAGISVNAIPSDPPRFERKYTVPLTDGRSAHVSLYTSPRTGRTESYGELRQANGNYVLFDIRRIAEKILDPALVPQVEEAVRKMVAADKAFMASDPKEFTDTAGKHWVRQN